MPSDTNPATGRALSVDGQTASGVVTPGSAQETAEVLAEAATRGQAVAPVGGGTALNLGNPPERLDLILSTERLAGIIDYEPTDLVISVGAGARWGDVQAVLGEHGQRLPLDAPGGGDATVGGLIATGRWGPLRTSAGTLRDLLIGIAVAHPSGTVSRAGGMVVKNVSGYDMPRLYHGSLGTLGVIVSANFKVLPRPRAEATIVASFVEAAPAFAAASSLRSGGEPLAALEVFHRDGIWAVGVRIEGREQTVKAVAARVASTIGGDNIRYEGAESATWWANYVAAQEFSSSGNDVLVRCGGRPKETAILAQGIQAAMETIGIGVPYLAASPAIGTVVARLDLGDEGSAERLAELQDMLLNLATTATILAAPAAWKRGIDVWGRLPDGFEVMQAVRQEFDPGRTINPGRFAGFL
jgi:glycolate oxidase FAD binding subunit